MHALSGRRLCRGRLLLLHLRLLVLLLLLLYLLLMLLNGVDLVAEHLHAVLHLMRHPLQSRQVQYEFWRVGREQRPLLLTSQDLQIIPSD